MKPTILSLSFIGLLFFFTACGQNTAPAPGFSQDDLSLHIAGAPYRCGDDIQVVTGNLGGEYGYAEAMSCDYDGLDKTYTYDIAVFYTNPLSEGDRISTIYTEDPSASTTKGVTVGSTQQEITAAYGGDYEDDGGRLVYRVDGTREALCFEIDPSGSCWAIYLTNQPI